MKELRFCGRVFQIAALAVLFSSCASRGSVVRHETPFPATIALLPFDHVSVDREGTMLMRVLLDSYLTDYNYEMLDMEVTDLKLKTIGIAGASELHAATPQKLGQTLDADALLYGELIEFKNTNIGAYSNRVVEAKFWLVDSKTGEKLWESARKKSSKEKIAKDLEKNELAKESQSVARLIAKDLRKARKNW